MRDYFNADFESKKEIRKAVLKLLKEYSEYNEKLKDYNPFDMLKSYDFFDSGIMFGVDRFDIVIMNPPYFQLTGKHKYLNYFEKGKTKVADIYQLFMETALNKLILENGIVSAVVSNKWMRAGYGERTRAFLYNNSYVFEVIDLGANWFESATVDTNIITYTKCKEKQEFIEAYKISKCENIEEEKEAFNNKGQLPLASMSNEKHARGYNPLLSGKLTNSELDCFGLRPRNDRSAQGASQRDAEAEAALLSGKLTNSELDCHASLRSARNDELRNFIFPSKDYGAWIILNKHEKDILEKMKKFKPLKDWNIQINYGIKTGFNEAFIIDENTKNKLISEDKKSAEIIKPLLRGRDIKRYSYDNKGLYLINAHNGIKEKNISPIDINKYKAIKKHLDKFYSELEKRYDKGDTPYNLRNCAYLEDFEKPKIVWASVGENEYSYIEKGIYLLDTNYFLVCDNESILKYLIAIFNSKLFLFALSYKDTPLGDGGAWRHYKYNLEEMTIPEVDKKTEIKIENLVDKVIEGKKNNVDTKELEEEIDRVVYKLYNLNENEISIIEGKNLI